MSRASIAAIWNRYGGSTPFPKWQRPAERPYGVEGKGRCRLWGDDIAPLNEEPAGSRQRVFLGRYRGKCLVANSPCVGNRQPIAPRQSLSSTSFQFYPR